jgi:hypothetical protein
VGLVDVGPHLTWFLRWTLCGLVAVMSAAVLGGCGGGGVTQSAGGRAALLGTLENWSALETSVDQARDILTQQCMAEHGLRYYPFPQAGQPGGPPQFATQLFGSSLWLGPQSLAWRSVNGWGLYEETMQRLGQPGGFFGGRPQEIRVMQSLRGPAFQEYQRTLWGGGKTLKIRIPGLPRITIQIGGCNTSAGKQLFGSVAASVAVPLYGQSILNGSIEASAGRSPALRASQAGWAACVRARTGVATRSPSQLFLHFYALYNTKGPTPAVHRRELTAAAADLECQLRSRLPQSMRSAELSAVGRLPNSVLGELQTLLAVLEQARARARVVFAHAPATSPLAATNASPPANGAAEVIGQPSGGPGFSSRGRVVIFGGG